jgi:hypothetical protein
LLNYEVEALNIPPFIPIVYLSATEHTHEAATFQNIVVA